MPREQQKPLRYQGGGGMCSTSRQFAGCADRWWLGEMAGGAGASTSLMQRGRGIGHVAVGRA
jgi:hypothetical protein